MSTARQLANLRPAKPGEVRNPTGRNQWTADRERREYFQAVCRALNACEDEETLQALIAALTRQIVEGAALGDKRLLWQLMDHLWPLDDPSSRIQSQRRRLRTAWGR